MLLRAALIALALLTAGSAQAASANWRDDVSPEDARRLDRLNEAWTQALRQARREGHGRELAALGPLTDPNAALARPHPTPGVYRCRTIKLGYPGESGLAYVAYGWFKCRVELTPGGDLIFSKVTGSQRPAGNLYPDAPKRLAYVGAVAWGVGERRGAYGRDPERDQVGAFERIGAQRYRLALPFPKQESLLDLIELRR